MGKTNQPAWVKHILKLLEQARIKDEDLMAFGAHSHQYKLAAPASEKSVQAFESRFGIQLPEEYRAFLLLVGNGGAGPYYGLYGVKALTEKLQRDSALYTIQMEPVIYPRMRDEDWDCIIDSEGETSNPYAGILPIGSQGCTLMTGLMLRGRYQGQVVYYDEDFCYKPFFVREKGFLAWYERWLREVIAGYNDEEQGFGFYVDGDQKQLMELYQQTDDSEERIEIIESYNKFETLPGRQKTYFKQACTQETNMEVRMKLIQMLVHFNVGGMAEEIEKLWEYGAYGEAVMVICSEGGRKLKEIWCERIFEKLPELHGKAFQNACYIFKGLADYAQVYAGRLKDTLERQDLDINERAALFYCIRELKGKEEVVEYFLNYLAMEEDPDLLCYAIQAMDGVKDRRLSKVYVQLLDKYKTHENARSDYEGSQQVRRGTWFGAIMPEGKIVSNLLYQFDLFGRDYPGAWKLLMNDEGWKEWKEQQVPCSE